MTLPSQARLLTFAVDRDEYALDIMRVREIARQRPVRPIPGAPAALTGVINLRQAEVIPILDLRRRFELAPAPEGTLGRIIVAVADGRLIGLVVDQVTDVVTVEVKSINAGGGIFRGTAANYFSGVVHHHNRLLVLLNLKRLLSSEERIIIDAVRRDAQGQQRPEEP